MTPSAKVDAESARGHTHAAYGCALEELNVVVIDPARPMQTILRSMFQAMRPKRIRLYDGATDALQDMLVEPPNLIVTDWRMSPVSGHRLVKLVRHRSMGSLAFVPIVVVTGHATRSSVESAFRSGANVVMVKPVSPTAMRQRIDWLLQDARTFALEGDHWVVGGVAGILDQQREKERLPSLIAQLNAEQPASPATIVERIVRGEGSEDDSAEGVRGASSRAIRGERLQSSPTLSRLMRQRERNRREGVDGQPPPSAEPAPASAKKDPRGLRSRWADIWAR
jgi:DNA-binding response OmpR family regulator